MSLSISALLALIIVLSMDAFTAALSYGIERVRVPFTSIAMISLLSAGAFTASLYAGNRLLVLVPLSLAKGISFLVLFLLSLYKFYDAFSQKDKEHTGLDTRTISRRINQKDKEVLSCREAVLLSLALSLDNISAGLCTGASSLSVCILLLFTVLIHFSVICLGLLAGHRISFLCSHRLSCLSAAILMLLAILRLF